MKHSFIVLTLLTVVACGKKTVTKTVQLQAVDTRLSCQVLDATGASSVNDFDSNASLGAVRLEKLNSPSTALNVPMSSLVGTDHEGLMEQFGLDCTGELKVEESGSHVFYLNSDDGSTLSINNIEVITNDGTHGMIKKSATLTLTKGTVNVRIKYFNKFGPKGLVFSLKRPASLEEIARF